MGLITETLTSVIPFRRGLEEGPLPLTAARVVEWLGGGATASGKRITPENALTISAVWDCVDLVSRDVGRVQIPLYIKNGTTRLPAQGLPLYELLVHSPNPHMTPFNFKQTMQGHKMLRGNAYANIERDERGNPIRLWPLNPNSMYPPVLSEAGTLLYTYQLPSGELRALRQDEVLHLRGLSADGIMGYSPITLHRETLSASVSYREYSNRFYSNNARPGGVLQTPTKISPEAAERLRQSWEAAHKGLENSHRIAILEEGLEYKQIGLSNEDAQYLEQMKFTRTEIASLFHVPPHKINEMDRATFSNIEEQDAKYENETMDAEFVMWEQQLNMSLLLPTQRSSFYFEFLRQALVRTDMDRRYAAYEKAWWMTPNEKRERENLNPLDGLDEILVPSNNFMPLSLMEQKVQAEIEASKRPAPSPAVRELRYLENGGLRLIEGETADG